MLYNFICYIYIIYIYIYIYIYIHILTQFLNVVTRSLATHTENRSFARTATKNVHSRFPKTGE